MRMDQRCDGVLDCLDKTDERDCYLVEVCIKVKLKIRRNVSKGIFFPICRKTLRM